jgi:hypothetical protein
VLEAHVTRLSAIGLLAQAVVFTCLGPSLALEETGPAKVAVIELFTSQGCSSCPAADRLLRQFAQRPGVIALSFPVAYWDYLGWKDTLARPENSERQKRYAAIKGGEVYTPEAIVNGLKHCVGSDLEAIEYALKATDPIIRNEAVWLGLRREGGTFVIETGAAGDKAQFKRGKVWVAAVRSSAQVAINAGENSGHKMTYTNVVLGLAEAGVWEGAPTSYAVQLDAVPKGWEMLVAFLQAEPLGPIIGAVRLNG